MHVYLAAHRHDDVEAKAYMYDYEAVYYPISVFCSATQLVLVAI
jgi:hypothetical protein